MTTKHLYSVTTVAVSAHVVAKCALHALQLLVRDPNLTMAQRDAVINKRPLVSHVRTVTSDTFYSVVIDKEESTDA
jgi:hypothetical protein